MTQMTGTLKKLGAISCAVLTLSVSTIALSGCDLTRNYMDIDRTGNMSVQDYRDSLAPRIAEADAKNDLHFDDNVPELQAYVASPGKDLKPMPLVSISINQTVPVRDALFELATQADYDLELDPRITGSIIFTARNRPFDVVIERICEIAGQRYKFEDDVVRISLDTPYHQTYKIDYLNYIRTNSSTITNNVSVVSGEGADTGSNFSASGESEANFWGELDSTLTQILGVKQARSSLITSSDPMISAAPANPIAVAPVVITNPDGSQTIQVQPPVTSLQVSSLPTDQNTMNAEGTTEGENPTGSSFSINRHAGLISINATERQHKRIAEYLSDVRRSVTSQVLIEAKIMEVSLTDEFSTGINWSTVGRALGDFSIGFEGPAGSLARGVLDLSSTPNSNYSIAYAGNDVNAVIDAIARFGTVKALASPRLTVLNNQSAVLNVADNVVYFALEITNAINEGIRTTDVTSNIRNVPEGVLINVQPSINLDDRTVSMSVRPTITRIVRTVPDPAVAISAAAAGVDVQSAIPVVNVQEIDSVIRVGSGESFLMGGLMQDRNDSEQQGVPVLSEVPLLGGLFRTQFDKVRKTELVIFLRATIIDGSNSISDADRDLYKRFSGDRRPLKM